MKIGVALGGGSARGYAHIGALACLERHALVPAVVVGTSFGALVGALYAAGQTTAQMSDFAGTLRRRDLLPQVADFGLHKAALFEGEKLERYLEALLPVRTFAELRREFVVVATDVDSGERVLIREGSVARALRASMALPGIFAPVQLQGRRLVDGGLGAPIPLDTLASFDVDLAIGIGVGMDAQDSATIRLARRFLASELGRRCHKTLRSLPGVHPVTVLCRALAHTANAWQADQVLASQALHVQTRPPISWLNFHKAAQAIRAGEEALERYMPAIRQAIDSR